MYRVYDHGTRTALHLKDLSEDGTEGSVSYASDLMMPIRMQLQAMQHLIVWICRVAERSQQVEHGSDLQHTVNSLPPTVSI